MDVPPISHPAWSDIVSGKVKYQFDCLAVKMVLGWLTAQVKNTPSSRTIQRCAEELHNVFARNANLPSAQRDLRKIFTGEESSGCMNEVAQVKEKIFRGQRLLLAGDESLLRQLPAGAWIGGTIPYFIAEQGGLSTQDKIYVTELPNFVSDISIKVYDTATIGNIYSDAAHAGFSVVIMPASSATHLAFALHAPQYQGFASHPLIGWIAGVHLNNLGKITPKVFNGPTKAVLEDGAVVMHVTLPETHIAEVGIFNIFEQGDGDTITFPATGFSAREVLINGVETNFAQYIAAKRLDTRLPLVADYYGAMVNVSFQGMDEAKQEVQFYAPVFAGLSYKHAKPIENYVQQFTSRMPTSLSKQIVFSCNCILNYLYSELEGKQTGGITGPITFGEVAYQLLNQTMVYLTINDLSAG
jgi:hypothetical protein